MKSAYILYWFLKITNSSKGIFRNNTGPRAPELNNFRTRLSKIVYLNIQGLCIMTIVSSKTVNSIYSSCTSTG